MSWWWARWTGKWHLARLDRPRLAVCGFGLGLVLDERRAPPIADRCGHCQRVSPGELSWRFGPDLERYEPTVARSAASPAPLTTEDK